MTKIFKDWDKREKELEEQDETYYDQCNCNQCQPNPHHTHYDPIKLIKELAHTQRKVIKKQIKLLKEVEKLLDKQLYNIKKL